MNAPFKTRKGWWYISKIRKHGKNKLWVGPFNSEIEALEDQKLNEK